MRAPKSLKRVREEALAERAMKQRSSEPRLRQTKEATNHAGQRTRASKRSKSNSQSVNQGEPRKRRTKIVTNHGSDEPWKRPNKDVTRQLVDGPKKRRTENVTNQGSDETWKKRTKEAKHQESFIRRNRAIRVSCKEATLRAEGGGGR